MTVYIEKETPGLDRRVFRYEHGRIGSHIECAYWLDYRENGERARWYGFANRQLPAGVEALPS